MVHFYFKPLKIRSRLEAGTSNGRGSYGPLTFQARFVLKGGAHGSFYDESRKS